MGWEGCGREGCGREGHRVVRGEGRNPNRPHQAFLVQACTMRNPNFGMSSPNLGAHRLDVLRLPNPNLACLALMWARTVSMYHELTSKRTMRV
eukprot:4552141-Prymnesium_polylepis.2